MRNDFLKRRTLSPFSPYHRMLVNILCDRIKVTGLPEEINEKFLLYQVLLFGRVLFFKHSGKYHVMWFSNTGRYTEYYLSREYLVTNPYYKPHQTLSETFTEENSAVLYSDITAYLYNCDTGLYEIISEYADILENIDTSIKALAKNSRIIAFVTGTSRKLVDSIKESINALFRKNDTIAVVEDCLVDAIKVNPISAHMEYKMSELIKARQYYLSDFLQRVGVASNQNMKAERLTDNESQLIENVSNIDFNHIINYLNSSAEQINKKFSLSIKFEINEDEEKVSSTQPDDEQEDEPNNDKQPVDNSDKGDEYNDGNNENS